jgi:hypothetical protein
MALLKNSTNHKWSFENIGGATRVKITNGEDIKHLGELDPKMWTVLSCPVKGLEIDPKSMEYIDCNSDGKIHVDDIIATAKWVTDAIKDANLLIGSNDCIDLDQFNTESDHGKKLYNSAKHILENLGKEGNTICITDTADSTAIFSKTLFNGDGIITEGSANGPEQKEAIAAAVATIGGVADRCGEQGVNAEIIEKFYTALNDYLAWQASAVETPYGENSDKAIELYNALDLKVKDYFMRSKLAAFTPESVGSLDVKSSLIDAISSDNLTGKTAEIESYPIARVTDKTQINLKSYINPAWAEKFNALVAIALDPAKEVLTEEDWNAIGAKFGAYASWKAAKAGACVEPLGLDKIKELSENCQKDALLALIEKDLEQKEYADNLDSVGKFMHIYRDFYKLLKNFVTFQDFYNPKKEVKSIFQVGTLIIDQRACNFCMNVADMGKHNAMAASSGMYLLYCDCTSKFKPGTLQIVAAVTVGEIGDLMVGKNAIFYSNDGTCYDAVVTKIIDNPISIGQAFWSPYRRMATTVENFINKQAAEKDAKIMAEATSKINTTSLPPQNGAAATPTPPFDIAKFAGIFAAIGMAVGMIGTALASLAAGIAELKWWQVILAVLGILMIISGPSMVMAWMKLRRRNFAPLLNANGWAINSSANISITFGSTLTDIAKFPKLKLKDPYAKKGMPAYVKWLITIIFLCVVAGGLWLGNVLECVNLPSPLSCFKTQEPTEEVVDEEIVVDEVATQAADTLQTQQ